MKIPTPPLLNNQSPMVKQDPMKRLSLAVRELDKLISRANQLASLSEQSSPKDKTEKYILAPEANPTQQPTPSDF